MRYNVLGDDKSLLDVTEKIEAVETVEGSTDDALVLGLGGLVLVGAGDCKDGLTPTTQSGASAEKLILASDTTIDLVVNYNGTPVTVTMSTAGLLSGHQKAITYGTSAPSGGANGDIYIQY